MKGYGHVSDGERWQIYALLREGYFQKDIASRLGRDPGTISRELKRNSFNGRYMPAYAQREYEKRRSEINKGRRKLKNTPDMLEEIRKRMLVDKRAPHSISGWNKKEGREFVCTSTIFSYIKEREPSLKKHLKYKKGYRKRGKKETRGQPKTDYKLITERPSEVETRERIGDMEIDTIHSSGRDRKGGVVTIVDRKTKYLCGDKVKRRTASEVGDVLIKQMKLLPKEKLLTITADNGKEFYDFDRVESVLKTPFYFAHAYASCERGTNEQTNGMIRRFYPKGTDFSKVTSEEIQEIITIINRKPRKSLNYLCAYEAFYGVKLNL